MYDHKIVFASQYFSDGQAVPDDTNADCQNGLRVGGAEGRLAVTFKMATATTLAINTTVTITLLESSDDAVSDAYAAIDPAVTVVKTYAAEKVFEAGEEIVTVLVPRGVDKWILPHIAVNDAAITTADLFDCYLEYLAN